MTLPFNIEPPQWMQDDIAWARGTGERGFRQLMLGAQVGMQAQQQRQNFAEGLLDLQMKEQALEMNAMKMQQFSQGQTEVAEWMKEASGDPVYMSNHPYTGTNPVAAQMISDAQLRASQSMLVQKAKQSMTDFNVRLSRLPSEAALAIGQMSDDPKTGLPTPMKIRALVVAEQATVLRQQNEAEQAAIEATQRGDIATTAITPKGVTTTFRPSATSSKDIKPRELTLSDGSNIIYNPSTGAFRFKAKTGQEKEMSRPQLLAVAKHLQASDFEDPNAKKIQEFLAKEAVEQIETPQPTAPTTPTAAPNSDPLGIYR